MAQLLANADGEQLRSLIEKLYGVHEATDTLIEAHLLQKRPKALNEHIRERIRRVKQGRSFIDWRASDAFSRDIDVLVDDIEQLAEQDVIGGFDLIDALINTHSAVYARADDSSGMIGFSYRQATAMWLKIAMTARQSGFLDKNWPEEVYQRHLQNDYAVWDSLLANSRELLTEDELNRLAVRFESDLINCLDERENTTSRFAYLTAATGLKGVAEALQNASLYARATTLVSPQPNTLQLRDLVEFCLRVGDPQAALNWHAKGDWPAQSNDGSDLLDRIYQQTGNSQALYELRKQRYRSTPSYEHLQKLIELTTTDEASKFRHNAPAVAQEINNLGSALEFLMHLEQYELAQEKVLQHSDQLSQLFYGNLENYAKTFAMHHMPLAAALCYRALIDDILSEARYKAYHYAARYFKQLIKLDDKITDYRGALIHADYLEKLKNRHGRKRAFWTKVGE
ncbi:hypothetical protein CWI71_00965 [Pseudidiomarina insulisalsae]|uniref:Uncharacterized protein n=1 Tax=Pseudidiomarina insulisalsae TaxID=575789 RepID=A0A432YQW2_9GAMM|nr:hypothetical protein CWI71_00965 [Pseudidiomarina insulisalsae]